MDANCAGNRFIYYKDPINYQPNLPYTEAYPTAYPVEAETKDRRIYPPGSLYYQSNYKAEVDFRDDKTIPPKPPYTNYGAGPFKESNYYPYYDQYKYNLSPTNNFPQFSKTLNYQNYQASPYPSSSIGSNYCDETNVAIKSSLPKAGSTNLAQYNYPNYYPYTAPAYSSQNFCSYNYSEESRLLWDDYQNNRRVPPGYIHANRPLKDSSEMYRSNQYTYPSEALHSREKAICQSSLRPHRNNSHCNSRSMWPMHPLQYPPVSQNVMNTYDRLNYHSGSQNSGCCIIRHEKPSDFYQNYKYLSTQHIPYRTNTTDMCSTHAPVLYNDRVNHNLPQQSSGTHFSEQNDTICYKMDTSEMQKAVYNQHPEIGNNVMDPNYGELKIYNDSVNPEHSYTQENALYTNNANNMMTKKQNLREFLTSWNEDEDDGTEKIDVNLEGSDELFLDTSNSGDKESANLENHLQFNGQFLKQRPKIHVGITVDSNVTNDQFINLPDIIIDIEKSKDLDNLQQVEDQNFNGNVLLFEPIDVSITDFSTSKEPVFIENNVDNNYLPSEGKKLNKDCKIKNNKKEKREWLKVRRRQCSCKVKRIDRKLVHKHCCKSIVKRRKVFYYKKKSLKKNIENVPKSLKCICISMINSEEFHRYMIESCKVETDGSCTPKESIRDETETFLTTGDTKSVPKLSALCENALNDFYEKGLLIINVEEELDDNNRLYVLECDINENVLEASENMQLNILEHTEDGKENALSVNNAHINEYYSESQDTIKDINSIHHEEIVPDNYKVFENKKFLQYMQNKYVRRNSFLQNYVKNKILSKYKKHALRLREKSKRVRIFSQSRRE